MDMEEDFWLRTRLILGDAFVRKIKATKVIVFGVGGVGSWCVEALVRNGIEQITIVDCDVVAPSNVNRQLMALTTTVGQVKVEAMKDRLLKINPNAQINAIQKVYSKETAAEFELEKYDVIIDAIDSLTDKANLILHACSLKNSRFYSSMGAALKLDPTKICVDEFWKVNGCPLGAALRKRYKKYKTFPAKKFKCVFSPELKENHEEVLPEGTPRANGSLVHITGIFGFTIAGLVMMDLEKKFQQNEKISEEV